MVRQFESEIHQEDWLIEDAHTSSPIFYVGVLVLDFHLGILTTFSIFIKGLGMLEVALYGITFDKFPFIVGWFQIRASVQRAFTVLLLLKDA